jgi:hypothetical protein
VASRAETLCNGTIRNQEPLGLSWRFKPLHVSFSLARRLVGVLGTIVQIAMLPMFDTGQELAHGGPVASQLICDDHSWDVPQTLEQFAEERFRGDLVAPALHQDIEHVPVLIHRPPQIMALTINGQKDLIEMPPIAWSRAATAQLVGILLAKLPAPFADGFVRYCDATFKQ